MILNQRHNKKLILISEGFSDKTMDRLLINQRYLLYDFHLSLIIEKQYKAINYFLDSIDLRLSHQFFTRITAMISPSNIDEYNKFIIKYINKGFDTRVIRTTLGVILAWKGTQTSKTTPLKLEYISEISAPSKILALPKFSHRLKIDSETFTIKDLKQVCYSFKELEITQENLEKICRNNYKFNSDQESTVNSLIVTDIREDNNWV